MSERTKTLIAWSIIPQIIVVKMLSFFPDFIERVYSNGLYILISKIMRFAFGWLPISFGDIVYTLAGFYVIRWLIINRKRIRTDTKKWFRDVFVDVSLLYFSFHLLWGMNYYRLPLHEQLNMGSS